MTIELPKGFLDQESRDGFLVPSKLKRIWAVELDLLCKFDSVCRKYGIKYHVAYGTMLGAVRHKGFIPWDDDLDVWLLRDDFEKLQTVAKEEFKDPYFLQTALSDRKFFTMNPRLRNSRTTAIIRGQESPDFNNGIFIDIYILDGYTSSKVQYRVQYWTIRFLKRIAAAYNRPGICGLLRLLKYEWIVGCIRWARSLFNRTSVVFSTIGGFSKTGYGYRSLFRAITTIFLKENMVTGDNCRLKISVANGTKGR